MGSLGQTSCGQEGEGLLFVDARSGPQPGQTQPRGLSPATCRISQPSLWWQDSWQPGWDSELPDAFSRGPEGMSLM